MANKNVVTYALRANLVKQIYYSPVIAIPYGSGYKSLNSIYAFLSYANPWDDDANPPYPTGDQAYIKQTFKNMFVAKQLTTNDMSPVIAREDWITNTVYDYYRDNVDMTELDNNGNLVRIFYVKNKYNQVFKCLWNNNGGVSTSEPYFEPGTYSTTTNIYQGNDGYKWKFMYAIDIGTKFKFMDATWIPVIIKSNTANPTVYSAGFGNIDVINIISTGSGYDSANTPITVTITGDGSGATATASSANGKITDITVTNTGSNYSYANVAISSAVGSGAVAIAPVSPVGGHGSDPLAELGCSHIMYTSEFTGTEDGYIPTDIDFHQIGLLANPISLYTNPNAANGSIYKTTTDIVLASSVDAYVMDETVFQGTSLATATFKATVLSYDSSTSVVKLINTTGTPSLNNSLYGNSSGAAKTILSYTTPNLIPFSGYIPYIENRSAVQRSVDGIEQLKIVIGL